VNKVQTVLKAQLAKKVKLVVKALKAQLEVQVNLVLLDHKDLQMLLEVMEQKALKELQVNLVLLVLVVLKALRV
jgi:hypothetical protein